MSDFQWFTTRTRGERKRAFRRRRIWLASALCVVFASFGGFTASGVSPEEVEWATLAANKTALGGGEAEISQNNEPAKNEDGLGGDPIHVLLLGIDKRAGENSEEGVRSDAVLIARVEPDSGETRLLSIPRDLYIEVEPGVSDRVNAAYAFGGVEQTRSAVEGYTGIEVDHHAVMDFEGFENAVDAIGGINVELEEGQYPENWRVPDESGEKRLSGKHALIYARYRDSANGDLDRIGHQQQILAAFKKELLKGETVGDLPGLLNAVRGNVASDVGPLEAISLARALAESQRGSSSGIEAFTLKGEGTNLDDGRQVLTPNDEENRGIISDFLD